ncbi:hypothetical protein J5I95_09320 [Candidatus Poribacteria bacterium]|nr:hypothetical protein [Candidatus Poribacteria bacterium]
MKNFVVLQTVKVASIVFILIAAFAAVCNVSAHDDHNQTFDEFTDVYLTGHHSHNPSEIQHRHAVRGTVNHPQGTVHDKLDLWQGHEHETPTEDDVTCLLPLYSISGSGHIHDGRSHTHVVLYARSSDEDFAAEILEKLDAQEVDHDVESDVYTLQYIGQHIDGVSPIEHTHEWEHNHGDFGWHTHSAEHSHVYREGNHPDWFSNDPDDDDYPAGTFLNGHEVLHPSTGNHNSTSAPSKRKTLALRWAELKAK